MQNTIDSASVEVTQVKQRFEQFSTRLLHLLTFVPDDKLAWVPSPTAKSALGIAVHSALTSRFFADILGENLSEKMPSPEEFFHALHDGEKQFTTRESVIALVQSSTAELCRAINAVDAVSLDAPRISPFGPLPVRFWLHQGDEHIVRHVGQLEYLQTIWGDLDNHLN